MLVAIFKNLLEIGIPFVMSQIKKFKKRKLEEKLDAIDLRDD